jgi:hypothetical protein
MRLLARLLLFSLASISGTAFAGTPAGALVPGTLVWDAKVGPRDFGNLIEASGVLIAGNITSDGGLFAFNSATGKLLWSHRGEQQRGANLIEGQRVFSISEELGVRRLAAFDLKTGRQLWSTSVDSKSGESDPILDSERIFINSGQSHLDAYDTATGARIYSNDYGSADPVCATGIALAGNRLFFGGGQRDSAHSPGNSLHAELQSIARRNFRRRSGNETLTPTALVSEAYLRLCRLTNIDWKDRVHFFAVSAQMMRRILVDHARARFANWRPSTLARRASLNFDSSPAYL